MTAVPKRIQRSRAKGWRMPEGAVYVGRPTIWGNPWPISEGIEFHRLFGQLDKGESPRETVVRWYREWLAGLPVDMAGDAAAAQQRDEIRRRMPELRGHDLACWCLLDQPCHADVLLELANA